MEQLLKKHNADLEKLEVSIDLLQKEFNKCNSIVLGKIYYPKEEKEILINKLKLKYKEVYLLLVDCIVNHREITQFIYAKYEKGLVSEDLLLKADNVSKRLAKNRKKLNDIIYFVKNDFNI